MSIWRRAVAEEAEAFLGLLQGLVILVAIC
jgi:hypothetical protein